MSGAVEAFTARELAGWLDVEEQTITMGTTESRILEKNPERVQATVVNLGVSDVWARFRTGIVAGVGIRIPASGGILQLVLIEDYMLTSWDLFGITAAGTPDLLVIELIRKSEL